MRTSHTGVALFTSSGSGDRAAFSEREGRKSAQQGQQLVAATKNKTRRRGGAEGQGGGKPSMRRRREKQKRVDIAEGQGRKKVGDDKAERTKK